MQASQEREGTENKFGTYHRTNWRSLHQGVVENLSHVCAIALADFTEVVDQRGVEEGKLPTHSVEVALHVLEAILPELADDEPA